MIGLLPKIQKALSDTWPGLRDKDVFLIPDPNIIPNVQGREGIGIKDGKVDIAELAGDTREKTLPVEIYVYVPFKGGDEAILDIIEKCNLVHDKLLGNDLGEYIREVSAITETSIKLMYTKRGLILRRGLFYVYEKLEE